MQCLGCFGDVQRNNQHPAHGMHLDNPATSKDPDCLRHQPSKSCSPVSNSSEGSQFTSSSGSGSGSSGSGSAVSGDAADVSSWRDRDQVLSTQQEKPCKGVQLKSTPAATYTTPEASAAPHATLLPYILQHGRGILSLSTLQQGLQHFLMPGVGYIAFAMMYNGPELLNIRTPVALGDPICDPANFGVIAGAFLDKHPKAMFMQVSAAFALVLRSLGLLINSVGGETQLDLADYTFSGYAKRGLRSAIASAAKGVVVEEVLQAPMTPQQLAGQAQTAAAAAAAVGSGGASAGCSTELVCEMQQVDKEWLSRKGKHAGRVWFINRLPVLAPEPGVRKFTAREAATGRLLGFIFFDAVYEAGQVVGYYANVTRMRPDAHPGVLNLLVSSFMDRVREEGRLSAPTKKISVKKSTLKKMQQQQLQGAPDATSSPSPPPASSNTTHSSSSSSSSSGGGVRFISLGMSPLYQMADDTFKCSKRVRLLFELSFNQGSGYYPFQPLAAAKAKYGAGLHNGRYNDPAATYQQVYLAHSHHNLAPIAMFDFGKMLGFWRSPPDAAAAFMSHKISDGTDAIKEAVKKLKQRRSGNSSGNSKGGNSKAANSKAASSSRSEGDAVMSPGCMLLSIASQRNSSHSSCGGSSKPAGSAAAASAAAGSGNSKAGGKARKEHKVVLPLVRPVVLPFPAMVGTASPGSSSSSGSSSGGGSLIGATGAPGNAKSVRVSSGTTDCGAGSGSSSVLRDA